MRWPWRKKLPVCQHSHSVLADNGDGYLRPRCLDCHAYFGLKFRNIVRSLEDAKHFNGKPESRKLD